MHNQIAIDHPSYQKIISLIVQNYYGLGLKRIVQYNIKNFHICRRAIALKNQYNGLLKSLSIFSRLQTNVTLNFVTSSPIGNSYNVILIIVNFLPKKKITYHVPRMKMALLYRP